MAEMNSDSQALVLTTQDPGVQRHLYEFNQKYDKHLRRFTTQLKVELGYTVKDEYSIEPYVRVLESIDEAGVSSQLFGHIKKVTFFVGTKSTVISVPREPGLFASDFGDAYVKSIRISLRMRGRDHEFDIPVEGKAGKQVEIIKFEPLKPLRRMNDLFPDIDPKVEHGFYVNETSDKWHSPICVVECDEESRPGYKTKKAHEFEDDPRTLRLKVKAMAKMIRASTNVCAYTGAGISTAAGINDYASKAGKKSQIHKGRAKTRSMKHAKPTIGHRSLVELWRNGKMQNWVQQNHDGLPQKAGFPQECINEIHGAWFDPSNPVVPMSGSLRSDLTEWLETATDEADLVMAIGTSMVGMTADDTFVQPAIRKQKCGYGQGGIIIALQQTQYDKIARLRIYSRIDEVMSLLMEEMKFKVPPCLAYKPNVPKGAELSTFVYRVPYDKQGNLTKDKSKMIVWDLNPGTKHTLTAGPGKGFKGTIRNLEASQFKFVCPIQRQGSRDFGTGVRAYTLGNWWIETCTHGRWPKLPIVNVDAMLQSEYGSA
jgi:NAD-dependent SIR2 family protein deacetylase